jgi:glycosyltransferase involved in cell wall biosynthesis
VETKVGFCFQAPTGKQTGESSTTTLQEAQERLADLLDSQKPQVSLVVPAYNEGDVLSSTIKRLRAFFHETSLEGEIIIADDGSTDHTAGVAFALSSDIPQIRVISFRQNQGRGTALSHAFPLARGSIVGYVDADLPFDLSVLHKAISSVANGYDLAMASKYAPGAAFPVPPGREFLGRTYSALCRRMLKTPFFDYQGGLKVLRRELLETLLPTIHDGRWGWDTELVAKVWKLGYRIAEIPAIGSKNWVRKSQVKVAKDSMELFFNLLRVRRQLAELNRGGERRE